MKTYEKIITIICFVLFFVACVGWGLFIFTAGDRDVNIKAYSELEGLHQKSIDRIRSLESTITEAERSFEEYKRNYRREYEAAISGVQEIEQGYNDLGKGFERIENEIKRAEELILYYFNTFGSSSSRLRVSDWEIFK